MRKLFFMVALVLSVAMLFACSGQQTPVTTPPPSAAAPETGAAQPGTTPAGQPDVASPPPTSAPPSNAPKVVEPPKPVRVTLPKPLRGIQVSGWYAGAPDLLGPLLDWAKEAGINALVLDVKAEDGKISWNTDIPLAREINANERKIGDINKWVTEMHAKGFWVVGRIVVMNDRFLYQGRPQWGIPGFPGGAYSFMDPHNESVWRYNLDVAQAAVKAGVDEIQFDYIRYPEKLVTGYNRDTTPEYRTGAITSFLKKAMTELKPLGVYVSADVFGLTTSVEQGDDMQIGQDYRQVAEVVDFVCAMAYPSHYAAGTYGIDNPDAHPYETVKSSLAKALDRTTGLPIEKHRPWIQDFTYPAAGAHPYGRAEVLAQVKALSELGIESFMLWDPTNKYSRSANFLKPAP